jgi:hypothetical protein
MTEPTPGGDPHVRALSASLLLRVEELGAELADRIRSVDPVYREGRIVTVDDLQETCRANLTLVFARLAGSSEINIQAPALTGRRRAEQIAECRLDGFRAIRHQRNELFFALAAVRA